MVSRMSRTAVIVEGRSDQIALEALARRQGRHLDGHDISIVPLGGAQAIGGVRLGGICDVNEEGYFIRALEAAGLGVDLTRPDLERLGFYVCVVDLEDELIRALGPATVEKVIEGEGELRSFRLLQRQPVQQGWTIERQLRRFISSHSGRKARYARLLVEALDLAAVPRPLASLVDYVFG
ncbi:MAG: ATP-dependent endonuclease [Chloroflexi bacterium]|nr:MAG: ATP-dependent endonuclease [Chloroflexota bacterium]